MHAYWKTANYKQVCQSRIENNVFFITSTGLPGQWHLMDWINMYMSINLHVDQHLLDVISDFLLCLSSDSSTWPWSTDEQELRYLLTRESSNISSRSCRRDQVTSLQGRVVVLVVTMATSLSGRDQHRYVILVVYIRQVQYLEKSMDMYSSTVCYMHVEYETHLWNCDKI